MFYSDYWLTMRTHNNILKIRAVENQTTFQIKQDCLNCIWTQVFKMGTVIEIL